MNILKEFALSLTNRHHFMPPSSQKNFHGTKHDTFMSLWNYDEEVKEYVKNNKTLSGYKGKLYIPDEFIFDIDGSSIEQAKDLLKGLIDLLEDIPYQLYFSGSKGFHLHISGTSFKWVPCDDLHLRVKWLFKNKGFYDFADPLVIDKVRLIRIPNTKKLKSGFWKIPLTYNEAEMLNEDWLSKNASGPRNKFEYTELETVPVFDVTKPLPEKKVKYDGQMALNNNYMCIQKMMESVPKGIRHQASLVIGSHLRQRFPEDIVKVAMYHWAEKVSTPESKFSDKEIDKILHSVYHANDGDGYNYGCNSLLKDRFCSPSCKIYANKSTGNGVMGVEDLEAKVIAFFERNIDPVDIGKLYGAAFPAYPGETILVTAPPESMKTMLLLNWFSFLDKPSYFLELEMSPESLGVRYSMINMGMNKAKLGEHYKSGLKGLFKNPKYRFDFENCYLWEIKKRLEIIDFQPEVIFIDHCGLLKTKSHDGVGRDKEISQGLLDLAKATNSVVIGVWEMSQNAFREGLDISGLAGSMRVVYNAHKVLELIPKRSDNGVIQNLFLKTIKNRDEEKLNIRLDVDQLRNGRIK